MSTPNRTHPRRIKIEGHPGLYQQIGADGKPTGKIISRGRDETGKIRDRVHRNLTAATRAKGKHAAGDRRPDARVPFKRYALDWLDTYAGRKSGGIDDVTRESYRDAIERMAIPFFGTLPLGRVDPPMLRRYVQHLEGKGLAPATIRRYFAPLRAMLATAHDDGLIPPTNIRVVVDDTRERTRPRHLTAEQTARLLGEIPPRHADVALLFATTGARLSEPFPVRYRHLGLDSAGRPTVAFPKAKTPAGLKPIPLTPEMAQALTRRRAAAGAGPDDLVFPGQRGQEIEGRVWRRKVFKPAAKRAGVEWATPHMLRHGVATLMAERGATAADIARILRHADGGRLAQQTYIHVDAPDVTWLDTALRRAPAPTAPTPAPTAQQTSAERREAN